MNRKYYNTIYRLLNKDKINKRNRLYMQKYRKTHVRYMKLYRKTHRERIRAYGKKYWFNNAKRLQVLHKKYIISHQKEIKKQIFNYYKKNKEKISEYNKNYKTLRRKYDIYYRVLTNLRNRIYKVLKGINKSESTLKLLGCSIDKLKNHLEKKFTKGMSWRNYGSWHIDHIKPCASFDLSKVSEQKKCFHYTNLQPLWAKENLDKRKHDKEWIDFFQL